MLETQFISNFTFMNENDIYTILKGLGFVGSEIKTYLASLEHGPATVIELTKMTKLSRQATYVVIDSLTARGLMSSLIKGKKRYYISEDPEKLLAYSRRHELEMQEKLRDLERVMPSLRLKQSGDRPVVKMFEGKDGVLSILGDAIASKPKVFYEIADLESLNHILPPEEKSKELFELRKIGSQTFGIYGGASSGTTLNSKKYFLPKEKGRFKSNITIYNDKVVFISCEGKLHSILIENGPIAEAMKMLFEYALKGAKELPSN